MKQAVFIWVTALIGCTSQPDPGCPQIERLAQRDAVADAHAALAQGDRHVLMLGGFVPDVPGVEDTDTDTYPTRFMEGTSDVRTEACARRRATAEAYAAKYNRAIVQGTSGE
jgi:hypothetical protein